MNKTKSMIIVFILIVISLVFLNLLWLTEPKHLETKIVNNYNNYNNVNPVEVQRVDMTLHQDRIFPYTICAEKGDYLALSFGAGNITDFYLEGYNINQRLKLGEVKFQLDKAGVFEYYCLNCPQKSSGLLIVK